MLGSIASTITDLLDNERFREYLQLLGGVAVPRGRLPEHRARPSAATIVSAYGISAALRMRAEEAQGRAEPLLAAGVGRTRFVTAHTGPRARRRHGRDGRRGAQHRGWRTASRSATPGQVGRILGAALVAAARRCG